MLYKCPSKKGSNLDILFEGKRIKGASSKKYSSVTLTKHLSWNDDWKNLMAKATKESTNRAAVRATLMTSAC